MVIKKIIVFLPSLNNLFLGFEIILWFLLHIENSKACFDSLFFLSRIELFWFLLDSRRKDFRKDCFCCRTEAFNIYIISRWYNNQRGKGNILAKRGDECKYILTRYSKFLSYEISQIFAVTLVTIISSQYLSAIRFFLHNIRLLLYTQYYNNDQDEFKKRRRRKKSQSSEEQTRSILTTMVVTM